MHAFPKANRSNWVRPDGQIERSNGGEELVNAVMFPKPKVIVAKEKSGCQDFVSVSHPCYGLRYTRFASLSSKPVYGPAIWIGYPLQDVRYDIFPCTRQALYSGNFAICTRGNRDKKNLRERSIRKLCIRSWICAQPAQCTRRRRPIGRLDSF